LVLTAGVIVGSAGCKSNPVGRVCILSTPEGDGGVAQTIVGSPALECESRTCLHLAGETPDMCTAACSADSDCDTAPESPCKMGFTCAIPVVTGSFCCEKLCICKDQLAAGAVTDPAACNAANPVNECCNLAGRRGSSTYPQCK
jgi:hypothetical protein